MADAPGNYSKITVQELKGLNERELNAQSDIGSFDILKGCLPLTKNTLTKANGCKLSMTFPDSVIAIHQCNDSRHNILVQTPSALYLTTENEFFNITTSTPNLIPVPFTEEENMSQAILVHAATAGTAGGAYTPANTWQQAPITSILEQLNPDGTAASFVSLAANQLTLVAGIYRISGYRALSNATLNVRMAARLYNVSATAAAWAGLDNEDSHALLCGAGNNERLEINGTLNLAATTIFEIQGLQSAAQATTGFGAPMYKTSSPNFSSLARELYSLIKIVKTA